MRSLRSLFTSPKPEARDEEAPAPFRGGLPAPEQGFVAIGDIHGCSEALALMWEKIAAAAPGLTVVHVGDYIDRGPDSAGVLRMLSERQAKAGDIICLKGNHEDMFLDFLEAPEEKGERFLRYGGLQTLESFKGMALSGVRGPEELRKTRDAVVEQIGPETRQMLGAMQTLWKSGNVAVVHAGADPRKPIEGQRASNLTWGHPAFGKLARADGIWIVHGHTIVDRPTMANGMISIDTGAYANGRLTAAIIRPDQEVEFLQVAAGK